MCPSFSKTNLTKIQMEDPNNFHSTLIVVDPSMTVESPKIVYMSYGTLSYHVIKHDYVQTGSFSFK